MAAEAVASKNDHSVCCRDSAVIVAAPRPQDVAEGKAVEKIKKLLKTSPCPSESNTSAGGVTTTFDLRRHTYTSLLLRILHSIMAFQLLDEAFINSQVGSGTDLLL